MIEGAGRLFRPSRFFSLRSWEFPTSKPPAREQFYEKLIFSKDCLQERVPFSQQGIPRSLLADSEYSDWVKQVVSLDHATSSQIQSYNVNLAVQTFSRNNGEDAGCSEVQVAVKTVKILALEQHLLRNRKDIRTRLLCERLKFERSSHLRYLKRVSLERFFELVRYLRLTPKEISYTQLPPEAANKER